jgi:hypothetical protein
MQYDKRITKKGGERLLNFIEQYNKAFQDNIAEQAYNKVISARFLGKGSYEIFEKRRENFSDDEVEDPEFFYIQKYKPIISRLIASIEMGGHANLFKLDLDKLENLLNFFERQGYLTKKQNGLIFYLLKDYPKNQPIPPKLTEKINSILYHHIKKDFMKAKNIQEVAKILTKEEEKIIIPKKKIFFSLSQIRNELSN